MHSVELIKGARDRREEEELVSLALLYTMAEIGGLAYHCQFESYLRGPREELHLTRTVPDSVSNL